MLHRRQQKTSKAYLIVDPSFPPPSKTNRRIAITGGQGFIGRHVVSALRQAGLHPVLLLRRHPIDILEPETDIEIAFGDLSDQASLERLVADAGQIVHIAGNVRAKSKADFFAINDMGTERLLKAAAIANPQAAILHISSLAAREPTLSAYAASKKAAEDKVRGLAGNRNWAILRPPAVYGPGDREILPLFRCASRYGLLPVPALAQARFSLIHVADLAQAITSLLKFGWHGNPTFEIDDHAQNGYSWPEIGEAMGRLFHRRVRALPIPRGLAMPLAIGAKIFGLLTQKPIMLSPDKLNEIYHSDWVAKPAFWPGLEDWRPRFALAQGFADSWNWYRAHQWL